jgi:hypothetical protein
VSTLDPSLPPRREDVLRHLRDLRSGSFEGVEPRAERVELFRRAVELLDPVVREVLEETNAAFLGGTGEVGFSPVAEDERGDATARWELSWPLQRDARNVRGGETVAPVQVVAWFAAAFTHPHLRGSHAGNWPMQVTSEADARRQELVIRALVEAELHERIFEGTWRVIPFADEDGNGGDARPGG